MRRFAEAVVAAHDGNRVLNRLISDRGRALVGIFALYLHFHADAAGAGLTPSRMAQLCAETGVCSRGRVKALLVLLRWAGHLAPEGDEDDHRRRPLAPTARMMSAYRSRWSGQLAIVAPMVPRAAAVAAALDRPEVFAGVAIVLGGLFRSGFRLLGDTPALAAVAERDNGLLLCLLLALSGGGEGPMPPAGAVDIPIASLAKRARVSRSHARNVLRVAAEAGLIARSDDGGRPGTVRVACRPLLAEELGRFVAASFAAMAAAVEAVSAGLPVSPAPTTRP